jgi:macrolide transport system ATP-binding/permease protein
MMIHQFLSFHSASFRYPPSPEPVFDGLDFELPRGWTGIVGANGAGKTTLLLLAAGLLEPVDGSVRSPGNALYCPQRTDDVPPFLADLLEADDAEAGSLRSRLGIGGDWPDRWETLSHGERKRAQIAVALWRDPPVLCIDEPTNHVDAATRRLLVGGLRRFGGIGLLVSHDRELLDLLCTRCVMVEASRAVVRPGTYTEAAALAHAEKERLREQYERAREQERALSRTITEKRRDVAESKGRLSKRNIPRGDHDAKGRIDLARITSKDRAPARLVREMEGRRERVRESAAGLDVRREFALGLWFTSENARRDTLFSLSRGRLAMGDDRTLTTPDLAMRPRDRIALTGPNGSGKSTLIRWIMGNLPLPAERLIYMPQELDSVQEGTIIGRMHELSGEELGRTLAVVNLLGSDPKRILASASLSPGELRKVQLAMGIAHVPHLIIMDEPTNHLDLPSIECLTEALKACACGLLLVSHDERFLSELTAKRWEIHSLRDGNALLKER